MAMTLPPSPSSDTHPASPTLVANNSATATLNVNNGNSNNNNNNNNNTKDTTAPAAQGVVNGNMKRKPSRRANTAERRATHNAVERQRRETLNARFLVSSSSLPSFFS
jgi:hypothetical protein